MKKKIVLNSREFEYFLTRKRVKNINLKIKPDGQLHVSANAFVSIKIIEAFLIANADRIIKAVDRFLKEQKDAPREKSFQNGEVFSVLGSSKILSVIESKKNKAEVVGSSLFIYVKDTNDSELKKKTFENLKKSLCEEVIKAICDRFYPIFANKGVAYPTLKFRKMKSRWGSCQPQKRILTFNTKLAEFPVEAIEYVVMHEFVHFLHPDHSKSFYSALTSLMPDWKDRKRLL